MKAQGFNLFVLGGPSGAGKHELVRRVLASHAAEKPVPSDWCHVFNFQQSDKPGGPSSCRRGGKVAYSRPI